jgi:hypothetical protein
MDRHWKFRVLCVPLLILVLAGCKEQEESTRWNQAQKKTQGRQAPAVSQQSVAGGELNRFFPHVTSPFDLVFKQEKDGLAQASLQKDGQEVAVLSIADTMNNPSAKEKYAGSTQRLAGHPMAAAGSQGTAILVADRYQLQARSIDPAFGEAERIEWLQKFDLKSLATP